MPQPPSPPPSPIVILHYPGASSAAAKGLHEMLDFANQLRQRDGMEALPVMIACAEAVPDTLARAVILPPAFGNRDYLDPDPVLVGWLQALPRQTIVASACAGAFYLGAAGLLDGRRATTHWALEARLRTGFPAAQVDAGEILIRDGRVITAGGLLSWVDLALELIAQLSTLAIMREVGRYFVADTGRREQRYYRAFRPPMEHGDKAIEKAQRIMEQGFSTPLRISTLAADVALSPRTFLRRFERATDLTPTTYLQHLRIQAAQAMLEDGPKTIGEIAHLVGYENTNAFRKVFQRLTGLPPSQYRARLRR